MNVTYSKFVCKEHENICTCQWYKIEQNLQILINKYHNHFPGWGQLKFFFQNIWICLWTEPCFLYVYLSLENKWTFMNYATAKLGTTISFKTKMMKKHFNLVLTNSQSSIPSKHNARGGIFSTNTTPVPFQRESMDTRYV